MKKLVSVLIVLVMCLGVVVPAGATEGEFVPSITYKPNPEIVPVMDETGEEAIGVIRDESGEIIDYVDHDCLVITPIAHVWDPEIELPADVEQLLTFVYEELNNDNMEIPYEKHDAGLDAENMVIRDLFDARWSCEDHRIMIEKKGVVFEITFDLGVMPDVQIFAMTYDEETKEWSPVVNTVNNGDGTVTCTFEHLCAIEFSMPVAAAAVPVDDVPSVNVLPWVITLLLAAAAGFFIILFAKKKKKAEA